MHNPNKTTLHQQFTIIAISVCMGCLFLFWYSQRWQSHLINKIDLHEQSLSIHYLNSGKKIYIDYRELHKVNLNCKGSLSYINNRQFCSLSRVIQGQYYSQKYNKFYDIQHPTDFDKFMAYFGTYLDYFSFYVIMCCVFFVAKRYSMIGKSL